MVMRWSQSRAAPWWLGGVSFAESSVFPLPPDLMLVPMVLAKPQHYWRLSLLTTACSVLGGVVGYYIGYFAIDQLDALIIYYGLRDDLSHAEMWFARWGVWVVLIAGFSPIPYKAFTIAAGIAGMALLPFILCSVIGRGARFLLVAKLVSWGGSAWLPAIQKNIERIGWVSVLLLGCAMLYVALA